MSGSITREIEAILRCVEKPGRYVGGEVNQIVKNPQTVRASVLLVFPDVYDIGMSYHGFKILYELVNAVPQWAAERAFAPWPDMEALMRAHGLPLHALESKRPALQFDLVGFTLQHELNYTNVLNMIDLAGAPVEARERPAAFPLFIGGGEGALAPEPLAPFLDLFVVGDGETPLLQLMSLVESFKAAGGGGKQALLSEAQRIHGVYVPSFYEMECAGDGTVKRLFAMSRPESAEPVVIRKSIYDLRQDLGPVRPVVPNLRVVHDRLAIEIRRGCARGCRFCSAGMITRPVRERAPDQILDIARQGIANTGFDEISLLSLSSADYSCILPAVRILRQAFEKERVSISLPSLRINAFDVALAEEIARTRKSGFTFAPEAGTDRLRRVINKPLDQAGFLKIIDSVCQRGWKTLKFYFMIGLPTETDEDLDGIVSLVRQAERIGRERWGNALQINVGLSPFVPKPHTPFQWAPQDDLAELERRFHYLAGRLRGRRVSIKSHDRRMSLIEAALARGDRRVGRVMKRAWQLGAKFDGWDEHFRFDAWMRAFEEIGIDPAFYANRLRGEDEPFPWDHIEPGVGRAFLLKEWKLAWQEREVPDCSIYACVGCNVCVDGVDHQMADEVWRRPSEQAPAEGQDANAALSFAEPRPPFRRDKNGGLHARVALPPFFQEPSRSLAGGPESGPPAGRPAIAPPSSPPPAAAVQRLRFRFSRGGDLKYLSHLDVCKVLQMACLRAGFKPVYSEGFNPKPRLSFLPPLPLGCETVDDVFDVIVASRLVPEEALQALNRALPSGMTGRSIEEIPLRSPAPEACLVRADYRVSVPANLVAGEGLTAQRATEAFAAFRNAESFPFEKPAQGSRPSRRIELKTAVLGLSEAQWDATGGFAVSLSISHKTGEYADPLVCLNAILGSAFTFAAGAEVVRTACHLAAATQGIGPFAPQAPSPV